MPVFPQTTGDPGDPVFLDGTGKLPPVDGSQLTNITPNFDKILTTVDGNIVVAASYGNVVVRS